MVVALLILVRKISGEQLFLLRCCTPPTQSLIPLTYSLSHTHTHFLFLFAMIYSRRNATTGLFSIALTTIVLLVPQILEFGVAGSSVFSCLVSRDIQAGSAKFGRPKTTDVTLILTDPCSIVVVVVVPPTTTPTTQTTKSNIRRLVR